MITYSEAHFLYPCTLSSGQNYKAAYQFRSFHDTLQIHTHSLDWMQHAARVFIPGVKTSQNMAPSINTSEPRAAFTKYYSKCHGLQWGLKKPSDR